MFEKEAEEAIMKKYPSSVQGYKSLIKNWKEGAEFGYNKGKEDVKYELMMKLKDEGIVNSLKGSILRNDRLSSQEQQELCAWIECAMDFGEKLDEWHYVKDGDLPEKTGRYLILNRFGEHYFTTNITEYLEGAKMFSRFSMKDVYAWKEIVLPKEIEK